MEALRRKDPLLPSGWPALVAAAYEEEVDSVQWLLEAKSNPNVVTANKASPLWHAVANCSLPMVQLLLQARADVNHKKKNSRGSWRSVLDMAINDAVPDPICELLQRAGAKPGGGKPPDHLLALNGGSALPALTNCAELAMLADIGVSCKSELGPQLGRVTASSKQGPQLPRSRHSGSSVPPSHASTDEFMRALAPLRAEAVASDSDTEPPTEPRPMRGVLDVESPATPPLDATAARGGKADGAALAQASRADEKQGQSPFTSIACKADLETVKPDVGAQGTTLCVHTSPSMSSSTPVMQSGSAFAARRAFRGTYSRALLPLCDDAPVLDFSEYTSTSKQKRKSYAGIALAGGLRGTNQEHERARALIVREMDQITAQIAAPADSEVAALLSSKMEPPCPGQVGANVSQAYAKIKPDMLQDPWGCVMSMDEPAGAGAVGSVVPAAEVGDQDQNGSTAVVAKAMPVPGQIAVKVDDTDLCVGLPSFARHAGALPAGSFGVVSPLLLGPPFSPPPPREEHPSAMSGGHQPAVPCVADMGESFAKSSPSIPTIPGALHKAAPFAPPVSLSAATQAATATACPEAFILPPIAMDVSVAVPLLTMPLEGIGEQLKLPMLAEVELPSIGANGESPTAEQWSLVKQLAGGARFHDPARDRWACREQVENTCLIDVRRLKFCHETISPHFTHGEHRGILVLTLLEGLHKGAVDPQKLPPLVVMRSERGLEVVCGNRRLYCMKRFAAEASRNVSAWCIVYDLKAQDTPRPLVMKYIIASTTKDGGSIKLRGR